MPIAIAIGSDWAVIGCWGLGALAGAALGFRQTGRRPRSPRAAWSWWRLEAWPFGRWNAGAAIATNVGGSASAFVLSGILGAGALGGMRAVQSVFAPLTLITPAVTLPGLPALARAHARDPDEARKLAFTLSGVAVAAAGSYALALALGAWRLLPFLFGHEFVKYRELLWPTSVGQLATASALGFLLWIKARRRGRLLMLTRAIGTIVALGLVAVLAVRYGLLGAAWGGAIGAFVSAAILAYGALRPDPPSAEPPVVRERVTAP